MKGRTNRDHELEPLGHGRECRRRGPRVERRRVDPLDVIEKQLGEQRDVETDRLASRGESLDVVPGRFHPFVGDVSEPSAEHRHPVPVPHAG